MRFHEMVATPKNKFAGSGKITRHVYRTNAPLPDENSAELAFLNKHVRWIDDPAANRKFLILNQYNDDWYRRTFKNDPLMIDFDSFYKNKIRPYYRMLHDRE